jgi:hypothetical protein
MLQFVFVGSRKILIKDEKNINYYFFTFISSLNLVVIFGVILTGNEVGNIAKPEHQRNAAPTTPALAPTTLFGIKNNKNYIEFFIFHILKNQKETIIL